jgi:GH35 family endo-1,4-beta-xylanase
MNSSTEDSDPYFREDPGTGLVQIPVYEFDIKKDIRAWKAWRTNDGRVLPNSNSSFDEIDNPFGPGSLVLLTTNFDPELGKRPFGGFGIRMPVSRPLEINDQSFIEFDFYYSRSAADKYMRFEVWSTSAGGEGIQSNAGIAGTNKTNIYIRTVDLEGVYIFNLDFRCGYYNDETWYKKSIRAPLPASNKNWEYLNIDLLTETNVKVENGLLMIGNIKITQTDPNGAPIPNAVNAKKYCDVTPIKNKYSPDKGYFLIGTDSETVTAPQTLGASHFDIFVSHRNLKPERHIRPPKWLKEQFPSFKFIPDDEGSEWELPTEYYLKLRDLGKPGEYKVHGHCLVWLNQSPSWMTQIIPENVNSMQWNVKGFFFSGSKDTAGPFQKLNSAAARRVQFDHILYEMRHFMTTDTRYGSSAERGVIPFHSFDVVNTEIHESRHSLIIQKNQNEWKSALRNVSWLMAMTDNNNENITEHYMYLLYKYAHIAVPNEQMAAKYKAGYNDPNIVHEYMKLDGHDKNGSIDEYISVEPPILVYNDYEFIVFSKAKVAYNMIKELNTAWKKDPLYDGRNLIECIGIQGHEKVSSSLASLSQQALTLFSGLIGEGLLDSICYSEIDIKQGESAPGGKANAPDVLNMKQADSIGYQYALLFKLFEKFKKYIDHVIIWNQYGSGWQKSYVLFDHEQMASQAYYAIMDPDRFIAGHSYLDSYFTDEYKKIKAPLTTK